MNSLPLHPVLVHVPLALAMLVPLLAVGVLVAAWRGWLSGRTWVVVVALQAVLVVGGFVAMQTGEGDEERVETVVAESAIHAHEEAAEVFVWSAAAVLALSLAGLALPGERLRRSAAVLTVLAMLVVAGLALRVGHAGGELVYRHGAASAWTGSADVGGGVSAPPERRRAHDDDD